MIGAAAVFSLLWAGVLLLAPRRREGWVRESLGRSAAAPRGLLRFLPRERMAARESSAGLHEASLMVAQLAALLRAGRTPEQLWSQAATSAPPFFAAVLGAAARAASLGAPVSPAIRDSATAGDAPRSRGGIAHDRVVLWLEVAACIEAAEDSGCPLAGVFDRLSAQLEADADAAAARSTALAGPKATTQILSVLPVIGLVLGTLIGADPLKILLGTPLGLACLAAGAVLTVLGRSWSSRLVAAAAVAR
ncbi:type II secretion system F family protein [Sinomonas sp. JGH33]|uniref:Type II secretion system F family protein n=1 Tax=Sinomonas terricola TaxID=3110330 RepID=A0ABU5T2B9_9MICC|nr:type II secretion system F family protein [Sinomonas sp. JGH33]MEA5453799.1 type II secretion system F family protein [Sinomonas sp. JGH33]